MTDHVKYLVLGAGVSGLSFCKSLMECNEYDFLLAEKESTIGGICKPIVIDDYRFDFGGHWLHHDNDSHEYDGCLCLSTYERDARIFIEGKYVNYPIQSNYHGLSFDKDVSAYSPVEDLTGKFGNSLVAKYGDVFSRKFFLPYNHKLFGVDPMEIDLVSVREKYNIPANAKSAGYNSSFRYPVNGTIDAFIQEYFARVIHSRQISNNKEVVKIDSRRKLCYFADGSIYAYDVLVSTIPADVLDLAIDSQAKDIARFSTSYLALIGCEKRESHSGITWVYVPEREYMVYRYGFFSNVCPGMASDSHHSAMYVEFQTFGDKKACISDELEKLNVTSRSEIDVLEIFKIERNYPLSSPKDYQRLDSYAQKSIYSIGRYGGLMWNSMNDDIMAAKVLAKTITGEVK